MFCRAVLAGCPARFRKRASRRAFVCAYALQAIRRIRIESLMLPTSNTLDHLHKDGSVVVVELYSCTT